MGYVQELRALIGPRPLIIPGAAVLIFNPQNRLLLQHRRDNQKWGLTGGSLEISESLEETARREAAEETGLQLVGLEWFDLFSGPDLIYEYPNGDIVVNVVAVYIARQLQGTPRVNEHEADEIRFFELENLPKTLNPPDRPSNSILTPTALSENPKRWFIVSLNQPRDAVSRIRTKQ